MISTFAFFLQEGTFCLWQQMSTAIVLLTSPYSIKLLLQFTFYKISIRQLIFNYRNNRNRIPVWRKSSPLSPGGVLNRKFKCNCKPQGQWGVWPTRYCTLAVPLTGSTTTHAPPLQRWAYRHPSRSERTPQQPATSPKSCQRPAVWHTNGYFCTLSRHGVLGWPVWIITLIRTEF